MSCGVGHRCGLDLALLWLWCWLEATVSIIRLLAWQLPYAVDAALKRPKKKRSGSSVTLTLSPFPTYSVLSVLASLPHMEPFKYIPTSGPLHMLFPHPECLPHRAAWLAPLLL